MYSTYQSIQYANDRQREIREQAARDRLIREFTAPARAAKRAARSERIHRTWRMALRQGTPASA
jgi:hypothetical protein